MPDLVEKMTSAGRIARAALPGFAVCATIAMAATFISDHHGGPTLLYALLIGMAFHFLTGDSKAATGISHSSTTVLRFGVALLGARISAHQVAELGFLPVATTLFGVTTTILVGLWLSRLLGLTRPQGFLTAGAVAICGASAALAVSSVLPKTKTSERDTLFTVIAVTTVSTLAMILYPLIVRALGFDDYAAGLLLGGTIHDVAQVVGAGHLISDKAEVVATYVKLLRVAMLMPVVVAISYIFRTSESGPTPRRRILPVFLVWFVIFACANSVGFIPEAVGSFMGSVSRWCLVTAISAIGIRTALGEMAAIGWRPLALVMGETIYLLVVVLLAVRLLF